MKRIMTRLTKLTLTALCTSVLIACGSGGGNGDSSARTSAINTSGDVSAVQNASVVSGKVISIRFEQDNGKQDFQEQNVQSKTLNKIDLNGKELDLMPFNTHNWVTLKERTSDDSKVFGAVVD